VKTLPLLLLFPALAIGQVLHEFSNGDVADAEKINQNFQRLRTGPDGFNDPFYYQWHLKQVPVDCTSDPSEFDRIFEETLHINRVRYDISGICNAPEPKGESGGVMGRAVGRFVQIAGDCNESSLTAGLLDEYGLGLDANMGGTLYLRCLKLDSPDISVFANSYLRLERVEALNDAPINIRAVDGGIVRAFSGNLEEPRGVINSIQLETGSMLRIGGGFDIGTVTLYPGASMRAYNAWGTLGNLTAYAATIFLQSAEFVTSVMELNMGSTAVVRCLQSSDNGDCTQTNVQSAPAINDSQFFTY